MSKRIYCLTMMTMQKLFGDLLCIQTLIISRRANTIMIQYNEKSILPKKCQNLMYIQQASRYLQVDCWSGLLDFSDHKGRSLANASFWIGKLWPVPWLEDLISGVELMLSTSVANSRTRTAAAHGNMA